MYTKNVLAKPLGTRSRCAIYYIGPSSKSNFGQVSLVPQSVFPGASSSVGGMVRGTVVVVVVVDSVANNLSVTVVEMKSDSPLPSSKSSSSDGNARFCRLTAMSSKCNGNSCRDLDFACRLVNMDRRMILRSCKVYNPS